MSNILPKKIAKELRAKIFEVADSQKYCSMARTESGAFMDSLVRRSDIGGVIGLHIPKAEVRTYIKDGVLNAYSKQLAKKSKPKNISETIKSHFGVDAAFLERSGDVEIYAYRSNETQRYILVSSGTFLKWETALRKVLLCLATNPLGQLSETCELFLILMAQGKSITPSDKNALQKALSRCGAKTLIVGE